MTQHNEPNNLTLAAIGARLEAATPDAWISPDQAKDMKYLLGLVERMRQELARLEWSKSRPYQAILNNPCCPNCERPKQIGHRLGCTVAALLEETKE